MSLQVNQLIGFGVVAEFDPYATEYTSAGTQTVAIPGGATTVTVECIGAGGSGATVPRGGGGGGYAKKTSYSVVGLTGIYISVPGNASAPNAGGAAFARENNSSGTVIANANGGNNGSTGTGGAGTVGDILRTGGNGAGDGSSGGGGGGAGPTTNGGNASGGTGGSGGGTPAGAGGSGTANGSPAGGGGGADTGTGYGGARGWIKLSWA